MDLSLARATTRILVHLCRGVSNLYTANPTCSERCLLFRDKSQRDWLCHRSESQSHSIRRHLLVANLRQPSSVATPSRSSWKGCGLFTGCGKNPCLCDRAQGKRKITPPLLHGVREDGNDGRRLHSNVTLVKQKSIKAS